MPIYEYECGCGNKMELYRSMDNRHNAVCGMCGATPKLLVSRITGYNVYRENIDLTVFDGDGNVVGVRHDHRRTPPFHEYHTKEVLDRLEWGQESAHMEMMEEIKEKEESKLARQV